MKGAQVVVTGAAGQVGFPVCAHLARDNEVWAVDLFARPGSQQRLESLGAITRRIDIASGDFGDLPSAPSYVLHLAAYISTDVDFDAAMRVNAEGTGLLLAHCQEARAALVMSTSGVYDRKDDRLHRYAETDRIGDSRSPITPTYGLSKVTEEAVARASARVLGLPIVITRLSSAYGPNGGMPAVDLDTIVAGRAIVLRGEPVPSNPIYEGDIAEQAELLLEVASVPATIVNWGGDDLVTQEQWCEHLAALAGRELRITREDGERRGGSMLVDRRLAITGRCKTDWRTGMRLMLEGRYPDGPNGPRRPDVGGAHALEAFEQRARS